MAKPLLRQKTFWTGFIGLVTAFGAYHTGDMTAAQAIQTALGSLLAIFIRQGMNQ